jgi:hypothetical protein
VILAGIQKCVDRAQREGLLQEERL